MPAKPPPIPYRSNDLPDPAPRRNTPLKFLGRMCLGIALGVAGCVAGWGLAAGTNIPSLFFLPLAAALATAIIIAVKFKRYGYVTGVIIAPCLIAAAAIVLLFMICAGWGK